MKRRHRCYDVKRREGNTHEFVIRSNPAFQD
jgi:hypothetical protein